MSLTVSSKESNVLLKQKNVLNESILSKYRMAGQIVQTGLKYIEDLIHSSYHLGEQKPFTSAELCLLGDSYLQTALEHSFKEVAEKGIAQPVTIDINDLVEGYSPEVDDPANLRFVPGDLVTINLGVQLDGYTARAAHTVVIYPPGKAPSGPLLGASADSVCASHIATEAVVALLGCALSLDKMPRSVAPVGSQVTGNLIRGLVDAVAEAYHCTVVPGSKVRRVRRFLAGQAEGLVAERGFKGVVWSEANQEARLLGKTANSTELMAYEKTSAATSNASAIPTDEFVVKAGEVYTVDIRMCPDQGTGIVTLDTLDQFTGKTTVVQELCPRPSVFIRDVNATYEPKLKSARALLRLIDRTHPVYPFRISELCESFPMDAESISETTPGIAKEMAPYKLGMSELTNQRLVLTKPVLAARFVPLLDILKSSAASGIHGFDAENPTLPGLELPLPRLGMTALGLKSLIKKTNKLPVAREMCTVVLNNALSQPELLRLAGGSSTTSPSWVHSDYQLAGQPAEAVAALAQLTQDPRFGLLVKECRPMRGKVNHLVAQQDVAMDTA